MSIIREALDPIAPLWSRNVTEIRQTLTYTSSVRGPDEKNRLEASQSRFGFERDRVARIGPLLNSSTSLLGRPPSASKESVLDSQLDGVLNMNNCDSCQGHVDELSPTRIRYRIECSGHTHFVHAYGFCMR